MFDLAAKASILALLATCCNSSCIDDAEKGLGLIGGWSSHDLKSGDDEFEVEKGLPERVSYLVDRAVETYNQMANDIRVYKAVTPESGQPKAQEVYSQLVNGINYCLRFTMSPAGCRNGMDSTYCTNNDLKICDAQIYTEFAWTPGNPPEPQVQPPVHCTSQVNPSAQKHKIKMVVNNVLEKIKDKPEVE